MAMEEDLRALLLAAAGVSSALGTRVYWLEREQGGVLPAAVLRTVGAQPDYAMDGETGLHRHRVQVNVYADTVATAKSAARAIEAAASGARATQGSTEFRGIFVDGGFDDRISPTVRSPEADRPFEIRLDLIVHHAPA